MGAAPVRQIPEDLALPDGSARPAVVPDGVRDDAGDRSRAAWGSGHRDDGPVRDFAVTLSDGRRVIGHDRDGKWSIYVYAPDSDGRLLAFESAAMRLQALERAGLCSDDAGEVLGRAGI